MTMSSLTTDYVGVGVEGDTDVPIIMFRWHMFNPHILHVRLSTFFVGPSIPVKEG